MAQTRLYYPVQALCVKPNGQAGAYTFVHGVQSCSDTADIPTQDVNEFGQVAPYEIVEDTPTVTFDVERVLDGNCPLYLLSTEGSTSASLTGRQDQKCILAMGAYSSSADYVSGTPIRTFEYSGMQVSSISYNMTADGVFTETLTFEGDYMRSNPGQGFYGTLPNDPTSGGTDEPLALTQCSGGVQYKENFLYTGAHRSLLPTQIAGVNSSGEVPISNGTPTVPVQSISISVDLNREEIPILGARGSFARLATFPVDVTCEIEVLSLSGHELSVTELGTFDGCDYSNAPNERIRVSTDSGLTIDLGDRNKLSSASQNFGDTGGANASYTLTYTGKSIMSVFHDQDVSSIVYSGFWQ